MGHKRRKRGYSGLPFSGGEVEPRDVVETDPIGFAYTGGSDGDDWAAYMAAQSAATCKKYAAVPVATAAVLRASRTVPSDAAWGDVVDAAMGEATEGAHFSGSPEREGGGGEGGHRSGWSDPLGVSPTFPLLHGALGCLPPSLPSNDPPPSPRPLPL